jgi:hypothetical protein
LDRSDTKRALENFAKNNPEFLGSTIVVLGDLKDSSAVQGYYSRDVPDSFPKVMTLVEAAEKNVEAPIVFLDDFIGSGGQARDIFGQWFDLDTLKQERLHEDRQLFGTKELEYLRSRRVGFVFVAGWEAGRQAIVEVSKELGIETVVHIEIEEPRIPFAFGTEYDPTALVAGSFKEYCDLIGRKLLGSTGVDGEKVNERALGYGGRAMLLISRYNVPTQVLTCLWHEGEVDGAVWTPLLTRRPKH